MAACMVAELDNGAVGSIVANYLCPASFKHWNNEQFRIFGTRGFLEITDGGTASSIYLDDGPAGPLDVSIPPESFFDHYCNHLLNNTPMPLTLEEELHPLRIVLKAKKKINASCP